MLKFKTRILVPVRAQCVVLDLCALGHQRWGSFGLDLIICDLTWFARQKEKSATPLPDGDLVVVVVVTQGGVSPYYYYYAKKAPHYKYAQCAENGKYSNNKLMQVIIDCVIAVWDFWCKIQIIGRLDNFSQIAQISTASMALWAKTRQKLKGGKKSILAGQSTVCLNG